MMEQNKKIQDTFTEEQAKIQHILSKERHAQKMFQDQSREALLEQNTLHAQCQAQQQALQRLYTQKVHLDKRICQLQTSMTEHQNEDEETLNKQLKALLEQQVKKEAHMRAAREKAEAANARFTELEQQKNKAESEVNKVRSQLEQLKMESHTVRVRRDTLSEQLTQEHFEMEQIVAQLPQEADEAVWEKTLNDLENTHCAARRY